MILKPKANGKFISAMTINFFSANKTRTMHTNSDNIEIMIGYDTDEITEELFGSLLQRYPKGLEEKMKGSEFIFVRVDLLYYGYHKISVIRGGLYIDSPKFLKKATMNPKNNDDGCFQYPIAVALYHD